MEKLIEAAEDLLNKTFERTPASRALVYSHGLGTSEAAGTPAFHVRKAYEELRKQIALAKMDLKLEAQAYEDMESGRDA